MTDKTVSELRDEFAGMALAGLLANTKLTKTANDNFKGERANEWFTDTAYDFADSMLKSREKPDSLFSAMGMSEPKIPGIR